MPVVARVDPKNVFTPAEWSLLTSRSSLRGMWLVAHAWGTIVAAIALGMVASVRGVVTALNSLYESITAGLALTS